MYYFYIFYSLLFLVSFAVAKQGLLNENVYVKQFTFGSVFIVMLVISLIQFLKQNKTTLRVTWGDVFVMGLFFLYLYFYWGTCNNLDFTLPFIYFLFYIFIRLHYTEKSSNMRALFVIVPIVISLHILISALQFVHIIPASHSYFPVGSSFGNPDVLGAYLAVLLPFCYIQYSGQKIFRYIVLLLGVVLLLLLQARTALVATVITGILYLILSKKIAVKQLIKWLLLPFIVCLVLLIWWHPASVYGRIFIWATAFKMIVKNPMGWGLYAFEKHYPEFQSDFIANNPIPDFFNPDLVHSPYNEFLNIGVTLGVAGLVLFVLLALFIIITAYKERTPLLYPICTFLIVSISYHPFKIVPLVIILIVFIALILNFSQAKPILTINIRQKVIVVTPIMIITVLLVWNGWDSYNKWQTAVENTRNSEQWNETNVLFEKTYPKLSGNGRFLITWADLQYKMGNVSKSLSLLQEADHFFCDHIFLKNKAILYEKTGQVIEAKQSFDKAVNIVPGAFNIAYERILFLQRIGEHQEAYIEALKLYDRPVRSSYYADPFIIKEKLRTIIQSYQEAPRNIY